MPVDVCVYVISRNTAGFEIDIKKRTYVRPVYNFSAYGSFAGRTAVIRPTMLCRQWLIAASVTQIRPAVSAVSAVHDADCWAMLAGQRTGNQWVMGCYCRTSADHH